MSKTDAKDLITKANQHLAIHEDAQATAYAARAQQCREELAPLLELAKKLLPRIAASQTDHTELVQAAYRLIASPAVNRPEYVTLLERCRRATEELSLLWRSVPVQLAGALEDAAKLTGSEPNLDQIAESIRVSIRQVQNVEIAIADNVSRLRAALEALLTEPPIAEVAGAVVAPPSPPAPHPTHATSII